MSLPYNEELVKEFLLTLENAPPPGRQKEQTVQDFMEENSEIIPVASRLGHHVHFDLVISKYALSTELITDYCWITKQSGRWRVVLTELESPDKNIFTNDMSIPRPSASFNAALDQVRSWKLFISENKNEALRRLSPFFQPISMRENPIDFCYELIIGRSANKNATRDRKRYILDLERESGIKIMSYDTVIDSYKNHYRSKKNILKSSESRFSFKRINFDPDIFSYFGPDFIDLSRSDIELFRSKGYEIDKWCAGQLLSSLSNGRLTHETYVNQLPDKGLISKVLKARLRNRKRFSIDISRIDEEISFDEA